MNKQTSDDLETCLATFSSDIRTPLSDWCKLTGDKTFCSVINSVNCEPCTINAFFHTYDLPTPIITKQFDALRDTIYKNIENTTGCSSIDKLLLGNDLPDSVILGCFTPNILPPLATNS